jgi:hypothetical protein
MRMFKETKYTTFSFGFFLFIFLGTIQFVFAEPFGNPVIYNELKDLLDAILKTIIYILTPIITLMVIYTGFLFVQAQGNPAKLTEARTALMWCLIGAVIVLGALGISAAIKATVDEIVPAGVIYYTQ